MLRSRAALHALSLSLLLAPLTSACGDEAMWQSLGEALAQAAVEEAVEEGAGDELGLGEVVLAGVTPAADYRQSGRVELSMLSGAAGASQLGAAGMRVQVENADGGWEECEYESGGHRPAARSNVVTLLLDGSGSMELAYPPEEYDDTCLTCPHDPTGARIGATRSFLDTILYEAPGTRVALGEFGPEPSPGMWATRLHQDFATTADDAYHGLDHASGYERVGTPLYDAMGEMLVAMDDEARFMEAGFEGAEAGEVRRIMVVLSDGQDTLSERWDLHGVIDEALATGAVVYAVGLGPASASFDAGYDFEEQTRSVLDLQEMAAATGGFYAAADDPRALHDLFDTLAAAVTTGYAAEGYSCKAAGAAPARGQLVRGRVSLAGKELPWAFLAP